MKTRDTQGSFILLIWTLIAKVKDVTNAPVVPIYPRRHGGRPYFAARRFQMYAEAADRRVPPQRTSFPLQQLPPPLRTSCASSSSWRVLR